MKPPVIDWNHFQLQPISERFLISTRYIARENIYNVCRQEPYMHSHKEHDYTTMQHHDLSYWIWEVYDRHWDYKVYANSLLAPCARMCKVRNARDINGQ